MSDAIYENYLCYLELGKELHSKNLAPLGLAASGVKGWAWFPGNEVAPPGVHLEVHYDKDADGPGKPGVYLQATGIPNDVGLTKVVLRSFKDSWLGDTLYKEVSVAIDVRNVVITASSELPAPLIIDKAISPITISASGGEAPYDFHLGSDPSYPLPEGLKFDPGTRTLSGTPKKTGKFCFWLGATDNKGIGGILGNTSGWKKFEGGIEQEITVTGNPHTGVVGEPYYDTLSAKGGTGVYTYVKGDEVPKGLTLDAKSGRIDWPSPIWGTHKFWLGAKDSAGSGGTVGEHNGWLYYELKIAPEPDISISPPTSLKGRAGYSYSGTVSASGGHSPYKYELIKSDLLEGKIDEYGHITGTMPHATGRYYGFTVNVTDARGHRGSQSFYFQVDSRLSFYPNALSPVVAERKMEVRNITATGGTKSPYEYTAQKLSGPGGVDIRATNEHVQVSGTPDRPGTIKFQVTAQDSSSSRYDGEHEYELVVEPVVTISPKTLPNGIVGQAYPPIQLQASGDHGSYTFDKSGDLPPGLTISGSGEFTGKPTMVGTYNFQLGVKECSASFGSGTNGWRSYTVEIAAGLAVSFEGPLTGKANQPYSGHIKITGGTGNNTVEINGLSHGLSQKDKTTISGTLTGEGIVDCMIVVTDGDDKKIVPVKITITAGSAVDLAISGQRGHFLPILESPVGKLTITGHVAGGGLNDTTGANNVKLKIKVPGKGNDFVDASTIGKLEWGRWETDGYGFTLSDIKWQPTTGVPRYEITAELSPQHITKPAAIVKLPIKEFVKNLVFLGGDGEPTSPIAVTRGSQMLKLHMAFYNAIDDLTLQLRLPNGVTADKTKLATHDSALPKWIQFEQDWDGHDKPVLFTIKKDAGMKINPKAPSVNLNVPILVAAGVRSKETLEAVAELTSKSDIVEHIVNNTDPDRAIVGLQISE